MTAEESPSRNPPISGDHGVRPGNKDADSLALKAQGSPPLAEEGLCQKQKVEGFAIPQNPIGWRELV